MFSIFPLLLLWLAALGFVLRYWDEAINTRQEILHVVAQQFSLQLSESFNQMLEGVQREATAATGFGLVALLLGASGVFYQLDTSFNKIWRVPGKPQPSGIIKAILSALRGKLLSFVMVLVVGLLFLVSLALTGITHALLGVLPHLPVIGGAAGFMLGLAITLALNTLIFTLLFKYLPDTEVAWRDVALGALVTTVIWEVAKRALTFYLQESNYVDAYGAVGAALVLMAWVYFSSQIPFLGAEFTEVYSRRYGSRRSQPISGEEEKPRVMPAQAAPFSQKY
jgi:membrane protein